VGCWGGAPGGRAPAACHAAAAAPPPRARPHLRHTPPLPSSCLHYAPVAAAAEAVQQQHVAEPRAAAGRDLVRAVRPLEAAGGELVARHRVERRGLGDHLEWGGGEREGRARRRGGARRRGRCGRCARRAAPRRRGAAAADPPGAPPSARGRALTIPVIGSTSPSSSTSDRAAMRDRTPVRCPLRATRARPLERVALTNAPAALGAARKFMAGLVCVCWVVWTPALARVAGFGGWDGRVDEWRAQLDRLPPPRQHQACHPPGAGAAPAARPPAARRAATPTRSLASTGPASAGLGLAPASTSFPP
jgi:hypothetical protein